MKRTTLILTMLASAGLVAGSNAATLLSEFYGDQPGADSSTQIIELSGTPNTSFDVWLVTIETDFASGEVDRAYNLTGTFNSVGIATSTISDMENPSFTIVLTDSFTGTSSGADINAGGGNGTDIDTDGDGLADDLSAFGTILDALGVIEDSGDPDYAAAFGGTYLTPYASGDPELVFRDGSTGDWYYVDGTTVYDKDANVVDPGGFSGDPTIPTFGSENVTIPEPATTLLGALGLVALLRRRR